MLIAPGIIVYERLLDAYLGKQMREERQEILKHPISKNSKICFLPSAYREEVFGFLQSCVAQKEEIGNKVTGEGLIAITNWHLLATEEPEENDTTIDSPEKIIKKLLPMTPGTTAGHSLKTWIPLS